MPKENQRHDARNAAALVFRFPLKAGIGMEGRPNGAYKGDGSTSREQRYVRQIYPTGDA